MADDSFTDPGAVLTAFADEVLVVCPSCAGRATVVPWPPVSEPSPPDDPNPAGLMFRPRRLVCSSCPHHGDWSGDRVAVGDASDPWFRLPLWLTTAACGHRLWAWNERHLDLLAAAVSARRRKRPDAPRGPRTLVESLPPWVKARENRSAVVAAIGRLRSRLAAGG
jgi:hypothetical protein